MAAYDRREVAALALPGAGPARARAGVLPALAGPAAIFAAALAAYVALAPRSVTSGDSAELTTAAATLGVPHPPGYPLYVLLGRVFAAFPLGDVAFRLHLMSGLFGALAAVLVFVIVRELTRRRAAALVGAASLAFSFHFWSQSLVAEVYTLDAALVAGLLCALLVWNRTRDARLLYVAFLLLGLALANRTTSLLLLPPLVLWGLASGPRPPAAELLRGAAIAVAAVTLYAFLPVAGLAGAAYIWNVGYTLDGAPLHADLTTFEGFRWYVSAEVFRPLAFAYAPGDLWPELRWYGTWLFQEFLVVGLLLGGVGLWRSIRTDRPFALLLLGVFVLQAVFFVNYGAADKDEMLLPTALVWAVWAGLGASALIDLAGRSARPATIAPLTLAALAALPVGLFAANVSRVQPSVSAESVDGLLDAAEPGAIVIGSWSKIERLDYFRTVEGRRPDLLLVQSWPLILEGGLERLVEANIDRRAVYLTDELTFLGDQFELVDAGKWYVVRRASGAPAQHRR